MPAPPTARVLGTCRHAVDRRGEYQELGAVELHQGSTTEARRGGVAPAARRGRGHQGRGNRSSARWRAPGARQPKARARGNSSASGLEAGTPASHPRGRAPAHPQQVAQTPERRGQRARQRSQVRRGARGVRVHSSSPPEELRAREPPRTVGCWKPGPVGWVARLSGLGGLPTLAACSHFLSYLNRSMSCGNLSQVQSRAA